MSQNDDDHGNDDVNPQGGQEGDNDEAVEMPASDHVDDCSDSPGIPRGLDSRYVLFMLFCGILWFLLQARG